jgi:hypothetical protein
MRSCRCATAGTKGFWGPSVGEPWRAVPSPTSLRHGAVLQDDGIRAPGRDCEPGFDDGIGAVADHLRPGAHLDVRQRHGQPRTIDDEGGFPAPVSSDTPRAPVGSARGQGVGGVLARGQAVAVAGPLMDAIRQNSVSSSRNSTPLCPRVLECTWRPGNLMRGNPGARQPSSASVCSTFNPSRNSLAARLDPSA